MFVAPEKPFLFWPALPSLGRGRHYFHFRRAPKISKVQFLLALDFNFFWFAKDTNTNKFITMY